jgi:hypothetical protein
MERSFRSRSQPRWEIEETGSWTFFSLTAEKSRQEGRLNYKSERDRGHRAGGKKKETGTKYKVEGRR